MRWILDQPAVSTIIAGVTKPHQLKANAATSSLPPLPADLMQRLRDFYEVKVRPEVRGGI